MLDKSKLGELENGLPRKLIDGKLIHLFIEDCEIDILETLESIFEFLLFQTCKYFL